MRILLLFVLFPLFAAAQVNGTLLSADPADCQSGVTYINTSANPPRVWFGGGAAGTTSCTQMSMQFGNSTNAKNATWLLMGYATAGTGSNQSPAHLIIYYSNDGVTFYYIDTGFAGAHGFGDPTWTKINGRYWIMFTQSAGAGIYLGIAYSDDLVNWSQITDVGVTGTWGRCRNGCMGSFVWAPEWFQDPAELPAPGATTATYHVFYASGSTSFFANVYHLKGVYTYATQTWTWTNEAGTSNAADTLTNGQTVSTIDPFVLKIGSTYNMVLARGNSGCDNTSCGLQLFTSSTIAGSYAQATTGNWTGQISAASYDSEAPSVVIHGVDGSGNPIVRIYYMVVPNSGGMYYTQASMTGGNLNTLSWSGVVKVAVVGAGSGASYVLGSPNHGTLLIDQSFETVRDLLNATAEQAAKTFGSVSAGAFTFQGTAAPAGSVVCFKANGVMGYATNTSGVIGTTCN